MGHEIISTPDAFKTDFPVSQGARWNNLIFCSGQIGIDPRTGRLAEGVQKQAEQVLDNLRAVLSKANSGFDKVLKTTVFLVRQSDVDIMNSIYRHYFPDPPPARSCIIVQALPRPGVEVEIELIAYTD
ncbi:MAG: RidA family protein [Nitrososphaeraceae archaeon]